MAFGNKLKIENGKVFGKDAGMREYVKIRLCEDSREIGSNLS